MREAIPEGTHGDLQWQLKKLFLRLMLRLCLKGGILDWRELRWQLKPQHKKELGVSRTHWTGVYLHSLTDWRGLHKGRGIRILFMPENQALLDRIRLHKCFQMEKATLNLSQYQAKLDAMMDLTFSFMRWGSRNTLYLMEQWKKEGTAVTRPNGMNCRGSTNFARPLSNRMYQDKTLLNWI